MQRAFGRLIPVLTVVAMLTACAARRPAPPVAPPTSSIASSIPVAPTVDVAALIARGCYACLQRALAAARDQDEPQFAFEAAALLAVRAKELGLPHAGWLSQARALAGEDAGRQGIVEMVDAVSVDPLSGNPDLRLSQTPGRLRAGQRTTEWLAMLESGPGSAPFRVYLHLALSCDLNATRKVGDLAADVPADQRDVPIVRYRLGACGEGYGADLRTLRAADAGFVDADYALGRYAMQARPYPDFDAAVRLLGSARASFPESAAIAVTTGNALQTIEAWAESLAAFDEALALVTDHPEALLGRTISLSNLSQHDSAIAAATRLIDGSRWFLGQAFYWRAWNQFQLASYPLARADADRSKTLMSNPAVYVLSGLIDWRMKRLPPAEGEFDQALKMDMGQCEAASFLGGVRSELVKAADAIAAFKQALQCYALNIAVRREAIRRLETADATPAHRAREITRHERGIALAETRRAEAQNGIDLLTAFLRSSQPPRQSPRP
jgi:tetratricopeptide (TPR) repeat protein